jgi:toxin FitB
MIVLDTDVVSALMRREVDKAAVAWLDQQSAESVWTSAVTVFEIRFGLQLLDAGRRRKQLEAAFEQALVEDLDGRILAFDEDAAQEAAVRAAGRRIAGRPVDFRDMEIAGIVASKRATLATRNVRHFEGLGIKLANPWGP